MTELLNLLDDGRAWSVQRLAEALGVSDGEVKRQMEFLEHAGYLRRVETDGSGCGGCGGCGGCSGCGGIGGHGHSGGSAADKSHKAAESALRGDGMPVFWEVVKR